MFEKQRSFEGLNLDFRSVFFCEMLEDCTQLCAQKIMKVIQIVKSNKQILNVKYLYQMKSNGPQKKSHWHDINPLGHQDKKAVTVDLQILYSNFLPS